MKLCCEMVKMSVYKFDCLASNYEHRTFYRTYKIPMCGLDISKQIILKTSNYILQCYIDILIWQ